MSGTTDGENSTEGTKMTTTRRMNCEMEGDCTEPVAYIDAKGYIFCTKHGKQRQYDRYCRKLRPHELNRIRAGGQVTHY